MAGQFTGEDQNHGGLDLAGAQSLLLGIPDQTDGLGADAVEDVVDEGIHDVHGLLRDTSFRVHLSQHFVDVERESLRAALTAFAILAGLPDVDLLLGLASALLARVSVSLLKNHG